MSTITAFCGDFLAVSGGGDGRLVTRGLASLSASSRGRLTGSGGCVSDSGGP